MIRVVDAVLGVGIQILKAHIKDLSVGLVIQNAFVYASKNEYPSNYLGLPFITLDNDSYTYFTSKKCLQRMVCYSKAG